MSYEDELQPVEYCLSKISISRIIKSSEYGETQFFSLLQWFFF